MPPLGFVLSTSLLALLLSACVPAGPAPAAESAAGSAASPAAPAATVTGAPVTGPMPTTGGAADTLHPGVVVTAIHDDAGPWAIHVVRVEPGATGVEVRTIKAGDALVGLEPTSVMADRLAERAGGKALTAVNGDFFIYDPPGVPTGLQVKAGELVSPPTARPAFAITAEGAFFLGRTELDAGLRLPDGETRRIDAVNRSGGDGLILLNRFAIAGGAAGAGRPGTVWLRPLDSPTAAGDTVRGVVVTVDTAPRDPAVAPVRLLPATQGARGLPAASGDTIRWWTGLGGPPGPVREAVGGIPVLVRDGRNAVAEAALSAAFADELHPRTAVGWTADGALLLVVVDGRQPGHSEGMSLKELADLMIGLGAAAALNLDGGGSSTLVVRGSVRNRPSGTAERAVANALVVLARP